MLILRTTYNPSLFNKLPLIDDVAKVTGNINLNETLDCLGQIFRKHGMTDKFGLTLVHRHFELGNDEILVESCKADGTMRVSTPWIIKGNEVHGPKDPDFWNSFQFPTEEYIQPHAWTFENNVQLSPFEFHNINDGDRHDDPPVDFIAEVYAELKMRNLHDVFGIRAGMEPRKGIEVTDMKNRANIVTFGEPPDIPGFYVVTVDWGFNTDGGVYERGDCFIHGCGAGHGKHR